MVHTSPSTPIVQKVFILAFSKFLMLTLKPAKSIVCFGNLQFCSLAELLKAVILLRINVYLKQSKNAKLNPCTYLLWLKNTVSCHPPFGSISKGGDVFFLLISLLLIEMKCVMLNSILGPRWQYVLVPTNFFFSLFLICSLQVSFQSCNFPKSFSLSCRTNLKSKLLIQFTFLLSTSRLLHWLLPHRTQNPADFKSPP